MKHADEILADELLRSAIIVGQKQSTAIWTIKLDFSRIYAICRTWPKAAGGATMRDVTFEGGEKDTLTSFARRLVNASSRARAAQNAVGQNTAAVDGLSGASTADRVAALEEQFKASFREWSTNLNTVLFAVERLERCCQKLDGEIAGLRGIVDGAEKALDRERRDVTSSAISFAESVAAQVTSVLDRLDGIVDDTFKGQSAIAQTLASMARMQVDAE